jgi:hypothetical protein
MPAAQWSTHPQLGGREVGGHRHHRQPVRQVAAQQLLQRAAALVIRAGPQVDAVASQQIEHHETGRQGNSHPASPVSAGMQPLLERREVQVPVTPHDHLAVEHRVGGKLGDRVDDLREVAAQRPLLPRLQRDPAPAAER